MKKILLHLLLFSCLNSYSQELQKIPEKEGDSTKKEENIEVRVNKKVVFGVSLGFSQVGHNLYEARISPINNNLIYTDIPKKSFLVSTGVSIPFGKGRLGGSYYRKLDKNGTPIGDLYYVPSGLYFVASVNLVTFNSAATGSLFNKSIDGGLGLGYRASEDFLLSLTYEMISYRQPRDFLREFNGKQIMIDGNALTALSIDNNDYFRDRYMPSISLKFVYLFGGSKVND